MKKAGRDSVNAQTNLHSIVIVYINISAVNNAANKAPNCREEIIVKGVQRTPLI